MKLTVKDLSFSYKSVPVLEHVDFEISRRELLVICGPNGVGKTTLLKCINRLLEPQKGSVFIQHKPVSKMSIEEIAHNIGYVSQKGQAGRITAFDTILMGRKPYLTWRGFQKQDYELVEEMIHKLELEHLALRPIDEMSGGELQKVCLARALVQEPELLLLDEPTSALDLRNQLELLEVVREIVNTHDLITVVILHDLNSALRYGDKLLFLKGGTIHAVIKPEEITEELIEEVYGVKALIGEMAGFPVVYPVDYI